VRWEASTSATHDSRTALRTAVGSPLAALSQIDSNATFTLGEIAGWTSMACLQAAALCRALGFAGAFATVGKLLGAVTEPVGAGVALVAARAGWVVAPACGTAAAGLVSVVVVVLLPPQPATSTPPANATTNQLQSFCSSAPDIRFPERALCPPTRQLPAGRCYTRRSSPKRRPVLEGGREPTAALHEVSAELTLLQVLADMNAVGENRDCGLALRPRPWDNRKMIQFGACRR
jgi:hypothetical protein